MASLRSPCRRPSPEAQCATGPADTWTKPDAPAALNIGLNHIAVTSDGTHTVFVDAWSMGVWRYVEP